MPLKTVDNDPIMGFNGKGFNSVDFVPCASLRIIQDGNESGGRLGGKVQLRVKNNAVSSETIG